MTTTDPTPLQERIERELEEMFDGGGFSARDMARDLSPIIDAEVRKGQAEALRGAAETILSRRQKVSYRAIHEYADEIEKEG